jgi:small subunit ribosomal protein S16
MAVRVRLTRVGSKKNAMWRVVVADQRSPRDGRFIEMIGHYNPHTQPSQIVIDRERLDHWISMGAEPSDTVRKLMRAPNSQPNAPAATEAPAEDAAAPAPEAEAPAADAAPPSEGTGDAEAAAPSEDTADADAAPEAADEATGEAAAPADDAPAGGEDAAPEADEKSG